MQYKKLSPNISVEDMDGTLAFYRDVLGLTMAASVPENPPYNWLMLTGGDITIMLQSVASVQSEHPSYVLNGTGGVMLYIDVDDVRELHARVGGRATEIAPIHTTFYGTTEFTILDPNGYYLTFAQDGA